MTREIKVGDTVRLRDDTHREGYSLLGAYEDHADAAVLTCDEGYAVVNRQLDGALFWNVDELEVVE